MRGRRPFYSYEDLTGQKFGKWTVLSLHSRTPIRWNCLCECGKEKTVSSNTLKVGTSRSCGCGRRYSKLIGITSTTHGDAANGRVAKEYTAWRSMLRRCSAGPDEPEYPFYAARGITVCERWQKYENFLADMGRKPSNSHTLDRVDNDRGYEPGNCRWATMREQSNNRKNNHWIEFNGRTMTAAQWAKEIGVDRHTIGRRIRAGWTVERAMTIDPRDYRKSHGR